MRRGTRNRGRGVRGATIALVCGVALAAGSCDRSSEVTIGPLTYSEVPAATSRVEEEGAAQGNAPSLESVLHELGPRWETEDVLGPVEPGTLDEAIAAARGDPAIYLVLLFDDAPPEIQGTQPYLATESAYERIVSSGLRDRVLTLDAQGVPRSEPVVALVRHTPPERPSDVPPGVECLLVDFLTAWARRDASGVRFLSPRLQSIYSPDTLCDVLVGTSNPHHAGFLIHEIASTGNGAWRASVSLFQHYTGYDLDLDPWANECWVEVVKDGTGYAVDSPFIVEEAHWTLLVPGATWDVGRIRTRLWHVWRDELALSLDGVVRYRTAAYVILPPQFTDVTGDGVAEVLVGAGDGGNYAGAGTLLILRVAPTSVSELWPPPGGAGTKSDSATVEDLDGAGPPELVGKNYLAAYWGPLERLCTACQVYVPVVYRWDGDRYVHASADFPELYQERLTAIEHTRRSEVAAWVKEHGLDGAARALALLAERALIAEELGETERGWARVHELATDWRLARLWDAARGQEWNESLNLVLERFKVEVLRTLR